APAQDAPMSVTTLPVVIFVKVAPDAGNAAQRSSGLNKPRQMATAAKCRAVPILLPLRPFAVRARIGHPPARCVRTLMRTGSVFILSVSIPNAPFQTKTRRGKVGKPAKKRSPILCGLNPRSRRSEEADFQVRNPKSEGRKKSASSARRLQGP